MDGDQRRALIVGALGAIAILVAMVVVVGADRVVDALLSAAPEYVLATFALAICWLSAWSVMLKLVMKSLDVDIPAVKTFFVYAGALFANNITPFGQAGGEPVAAMLISKASDSRYETGLVGIASVDVLNVVPSISLVFVGVGYYATTTAIGSRIETAVSSAVVLIAAILIVLTLVWRFRYAIIERLPPVIAPRLGEFGIAQLDADTLETELTDRMERFFENIERVAASRWRLTAVVGLSLTGWLFQVGALLTAFAALGHAVSPAVLLFVIPLANLAGATPLPGGVGGIEAVFVTLLVATTGISASAITAAVLIFRGAIFGVPLVIGGASMSAFGIRALQ